MAVLKCKMCGANLEIPEKKETVCTCEYCGTKQTLPKLDNDEQLNLYDRANHFFRNNEYDKATSIYERILMEDPEAAEAYWSLVLCRYGIEYVEDPTTHKRVPTINRAQFTAIYDDENYKSALQYADANQRAVYEEEANVINEIQKGILSISQKEDPFDVFICYKETDENGRRTQDSVLANDLYYQLKQEGFRTFFARITLEDKLGVAYEPYIFAALNSAKVMVVLGTKPEHFSAVWVKNEWSRYLSLVKNGAGKKTLIPAYKDMDPYDLPEEFSHLQALDMSKLGFMQDLIRGIKKICKTDEPKVSSKETIIVNSGDANVVSLLKRVFIFLEDGEWGKADEFCEKVLNIDPENGEAYLGKLMLELRVKKENDLEKLSDPFDNSSNYQKIIRFGDKKLSSRIKGYIDSIKIRKLEEIYNKAVSEKEIAKSESGYKTAASHFELIPDYKDAKQLYKECLDNAEICRKDAIYRHAKSVMDVKSIVNYKKAIELFESIKGWNDSEKQIDICYEKIEEEERLEKERQEEARRTAKKRAIKTIIKLSATFLIIILLIVAFIVAIVWADNYEKTHPHGKIGDLNWKINNGVLTIYGKGEWEYRYNKPWEEYYNLYDEIVIGDGVTSIVENAFCNDDITKVTFGDDCVYIGDSAFAGCRQISGELIIPDGCTYIGNSAFADCSQISGELIIPDGCTYIGNSAFAGCKKISGDLVIPDGCTSIGAYAFSNTDISSVIIPETLINMHEGSFYLCTNLQKVQLSESLKEIPESCFSCCSNITVIVIPSGIVSIGNSAFSGCSNLENIVLPDSVQNIGMHAFSSCSNLKEVKMTENINHVGQGAFANCENINYMMVPSWTESTDIYKWGTFSAGDSKYTDLNSNSTIVYTNGEIFE